MTFSIFIINAHIEIYFIVRIAFLNVVHYKTLNTTINIQLLVINPPKPTWGPRCTFTLLPVALARGSLLVTLISYTRQKTRITNVLIGVSWGSSDSCFRTLSFQSFISMGDYTPKVMNRPIQLWSESIGHLLVCSGVISSLTTFCVPCLPPIQITRC
jgi:hypothetical protein